VEDQGAEACEQQGGGHRKTGNDRDQDCGSEHGEHVLEAEGKHLAATERAGIVDGLLVVCHKYKVLELSFLSPSGLMTMQIYAKKMETPKRDFLFF
jgi:hypothetical protein